MNQFLEEITNKSEEIFHDFDNISEKPHELLSEFDDNLKSQINIEIIDLEIERINNLEISTSNEKNSNVLDEKILEKRKDLIIIKKVLNGLKNNSNDINAFLVLEKKYKRLIRSLIKKMIKDEDDVDDLVQETFIKSFKALHNYHPAYTFSSWIYRIASNSCIDFLRKKKLNTFSINQVSKKDDEEIIYEIEDNDYKPDLGMLNSEKSKILYNAINNLPNNYKEIIHLRHTEDMDYAEISEKLNMPLGTVKAHLFRARKMLYEALKSNQHLFRN